MIVGTRVRMGLPALLSAAALLTALVPAYTASAGPARAASTCLTIASEQQNPWQRDFSPFSGTARESARGGIYEPLMIMSVVVQKPIPWLATAYKWTNGAKSLVITIRDGVKWSDGQPFTAKDVVFTMTYGKVDPAADQIGYSGTASNIASVKQTGPSEVTINFKKTNVTVLQPILGGIRIIPEHVWASIKTPGKTIVTNPVGTGPFTEVRSFSGQEYVLGKNTSYWQAGKPAVDCLRFPAYSGNDPENLATIKGDVDLAANFLPKIENVYTPRDPAHFHYFFSTTGNTATGLFYNVEKYPWSLVGFRKAVSMALNRSVISRIGQYGYSPPADATGIGLAFPSWLDKSVAQEAAALVTYNPTKSRQMLTDLGFKLVDKQLMDPKGKPVRMELRVIGGWTDWVGSMKLVQKYMKDIGIDAALKLDPSFGSWATPTEAGLVAHFHWVNGTDPYGYFYSIMHTKSYVKTGVSAATSSNWSRYTNVQASTLLDQFTQTTDEAQQHAIMAKIEKIMVTDLPFIPVFVNPRWYEYNTTRFTGFPTKDNEYAAGPFYAYPDKALVLNRVTPVK